MSAGPAQDPPPCTRPKPLHSRCTRIVPRCAALLRCVVLRCVVLFACVAAGSGCAVAWNVEGQVAMGGTSPQVIETTVALREAIASRSACARAARTDPVDRDLQRKRDLARLDSLYVQAVAWSDGDVRLALVALAVATLPYRTFPATIPLTGWVMTVPVSDESVNAFEARLRALPSELFADTPAGGDRDKLPHFFGSAWLALTFGCDPLASAMGILVEQLESWFKLEGSSDARDLETDELGIAFARRLRDDVRVLPSTLFRFKTSLTTDIPGSVQLR